MLGYYRLRRRSRCCGCAQVGLLVVHANVGRKMEGAPTARLTVDPQLASHKLDELLGDGQPQARAAILACRGAIGLDKRLQNRLLPIERDADATIPDRHVQHPALPVSGLRLGCFLDGDLDDDLSLCGEFDGVAHQIDQDLAQAAGIANHPFGHSVLHHIQQLKSLAVGLQGQGFYGGVQRIAQSKGEWGEF